MEDEKEFGLEISPPHKIYKVNLKKKRSDVITVVNQQLSIKDKPDVAATDDVEWEEVVQRGTSSTSSSSVIIGTEARGGSSTVTSTCKNYD